MPHVAKLSIKTLCVGQLQTNCYILYDQKTLGALIIDPGDDAEYIEDNIHRLGITPLAIMATHGHFDHCLAVLELKLAYNIPFLMNKKDEFLLKRQPVTADPPPLIDYDIHKNSDGGVFRDISIIDTPGHTPGSVSIYAPSSNFCVVGDLLFADGSVGRYDFAYSNKTVLAASVQKVLSLPASTVIYPGHGESFRLSSLKPFSKTVLKIGDS